MTDGHLNFDCARETAASFAPTLFGQGVGPSVSSWAPAPSPEPRDVVQAAIETVLATRTREEFLAALQGSLSVALPIALRDALGGNGSGEPGPGQKAWLRDDRDGCDFVRTTIGRAVRIGSELGKEPEPAGQGAVEKKYAREFYGDLALFTYGSAVLDALAVKSPARTDEIGAMRMWMRYAAEGAASAAMACRRRRREIAATPIESVDSAFYLRVIGAES